MTLRLRYPDPRIVPNVAAVGQVSRRQVREAELRLWLGCRAHAAPAVVDWVELAISDCQRRLGLAQVEGAMS